MTAALDPSRQIAGICREVLKLYDQSLRLASSDPQKLQKEARIQSQMAFKLLAARSPLEELARSREAGSAVRLREAALDLLKACLKAKLPKEAKHILDNCLSGTAAGSLVSPDRRRLLRDLIEGFLEAGLIREAEELFWSLEMPEPGSQEVRPAGLLYLAFIILYGLRKRPDLASVIYNRFLTLVSQNRPAPAGRPAVLTLIPPLARPPAEPEDPEASPAGTAESRSPDGTAESRPPAGTAEPRPPAGTAETRPPAGTAESRPSAEAAGTAASSRPAEKTGRRTPAGPGSPGGPGSETFPAPAAFPAEAEAPSAYSSEPDPAAQDSPPGTMAAGFSVISVSDLFPPFPEHGLPVNTHTPAHRQALEVISPGKGCSEAVPPKGSLEDSGAGRKPEILFFYKPPAQDEDALETNFSLAAEKMADIACLSREYGRLAELYRSLDVLAGSPRENEYRASFILRVLFSLDPLKHQKTAAEYQEILRSLPDFPKKKACLDESLYYLMLFHQDDPDLVRCRELFEELRASAGFPDENQFNMISLRGFQLMIRLYCVQGLTDQAYQLCLEGFRLGRWTLWAGAIAETLSCAVSALAAFGRLPEAARLYRLLEEIPDGEWAQPLRQRTGVSFLLQLSLPGHWDHWLELVQDLGRSSKMPGRLLNSFIAACEKAVRSLAEAGAVQALKTLVQTFRQLKFLPPFQRDILIGRVHLALLDWHLTRSQAGGASESLAAVLALGSASEELTLKGQAFLLEIRHRLAGDWEDCLAVLEQIRSLGRRPEVMDCLAQGILILAGRAVLAGRTGLVRELGQSLWELASENKALGLAVPAEELGKMSALSALALLRDGQFEPAEDLFLAHLERHPFPARYARQVLSLLTGCLIQKGEAAEADLLAEKAASLGALPEAEAALVPGEMYLALIKHLAASLKLAEAETQLWELAGLCRRPVFLPFYAEALFCLVQACGRSGQFFAPPKLVRPPRLRPAGLSPDSSQSSQMVPGRYAARFLALLMELSSQDSRIRLLKHRAAGCLAGLLVQKEQLNKAREIYELYLEKETPQRYEETKIRLNTALTITLELLKSDPAEAAGFFKRLLDGDYPAWLVKYSLTDLGLLLKTLQENRLEKDRSEILAALDACLTPADRTFLEKF